MTEPNPILKNLRESAGLRLTVLFGSFFILLMIVSTLALAIDNFNLGDQREKGLLTATLQCIFGFIVPSFLLARFCSKQPLRWLRLEKKLSLRPILGVVIVYLISLPAMEFLIEWNNQIHLPESMSELENLLRKWEEANAEAASILLQGHGLTAILLGVLVIGVLTGISEEMFFRGGLQRILTDSKIGAGISIWIAAIIFSSMHFQFFGFIPRLLMGAFFGYLLVWTNDLKVSAFGHILNNSIVVVVASLSVGQSVSANEVSLVPDIPYLPLISAVSTVLFFIFFKDFFFKKRSSPALSWQKKQCPPASGI